AARRDDRKMRRIKHLAQHFRFHPAMDGNDSIKPHGCASRTKRCKLGAVAADIQSGHRRFLPIDRSHHLEKIEYTLLPGNAAREYHSERLQIGWRPQLEKSRSKLRQYLFGTAGLAVGDFSDLT